MLCIALLVGGCGDDMGGPIDAGPDATADAPVDAPLNRAVCPDGYGPSFIADSVVVPPQSMGFDLNGDGTVDNELGQLRTLLNPTLRDMTHKSPYLIISVERLDDPQNDPDVGPVIYQGVDADGDPSNDFSGMGQFWFTLNSVDDNCRPLAILPSGALVNGHFEASADHALIPLNFAVFDIRRAHVTGDIAPDLSGLSNVLVGGAATPCKLSQTQQTITNQSVLDLLVAGFSVQPDIDLDGDGLETFVASPSAGVYACIDGNGTRIDGKTCTCDPRIADGFSLALQVTAIKATLLGPVPLPDGGP
jgi:hypothetical protein